MKKKIAIIGAGISGLVFANFLRKESKYNFSLYERNNSIDLNQGYGVQLAVNSINILNKIGFQSFKTDEKMHFAVFAVSSDVSAGSHALAGKYVGGELNAAAGVGLGAKALVGGSNDSFSLQPLALETSTGIGASGGLSFLYIEADK